MKKLLFLFVLIFLISCTTQIDVDDSIQNGLSYLNTVYEDGRYNDEYLLYVYPGEDLECPIEDCHLTYRILDAYFNLIYIKNEIKDYSVIRDQVEYGDEILQSLLPIWREGRIYNTIASIKEDKDGFALDTYCILGYLYNDKEMAVNTLNYLDNNNWMADDYFREDEWRNIADESWCVRLLLKTKTMPELTNDLLQIKLNETYEFIEEDYDKSTKIAAVVHTILMLSDAEGYNEDLKFFQDYVLDLSYDVDDWHLQANVLEALARSKYEDKEKMRGIADLLISKQAEDGAWYMNEDKENFLQVFTTFRGVLALNQYQNL